MINNYFLAVGRLGGGARSSCIGQIWGEGQGLLAGGQIWGLYLGGQIGASYHCVEEGQAE